MLAGSKFLPESNLIMPEFTCSACGPFTEHRELTKKFKETSDLNYIYEIPSMTKTIVINSNQITSEKNVTGRNKTEFSRNRQGIILQ